MKIRTLPLHFSVPVIGCLLIVLANAAQANELSRATNQTEQHHNATASSQQRIDRLSDKALSASEEYLSNEKQADLTTAYNNQLSRLVDSQQKEIDDLQQQIDSIEKTEQAMLPMLQSMLDALARFIAADTPFLPEERQTRLTNLATLLERADISIAEKYRQLLDAYRIEVDYGRTMTTYRGTLTAADNASRQVNYLRLGRAALYYQTLNGLESALWLPQSRSWQPLTEQQNLTLRRAIQIARQHSVPSTLPLPLPPITQ